MLRRYAPIKKSRGTVIPASLRAEVLAADGYRCVGHQLLDPPMPGDCLCPFGGRLELDHVRASGAIGRKSATERGNLVSLCSAAHRQKTDNGRKYRPLLLAYIERRDAA